jgi:hypothetical protein
MTKHEEINDFLSKFGDRLPDPDHYPRTFAYFVRLYRLQKSVEQAEKNKENK